MIEFLWHIYNLVCQWFRYFTPTFNNFSCDRLWQFGPGSHFLYWLLTLGNGVTRGMRDDVGSHQ